MVDVFISYSRADQAKVAMLARAVEAEGYDVWWDAELPPHQSYGEVITDKIEHARAAIVVWSATAVKSEWVRAEADMARHHRKLVQTAIDDVIPPLPFNQIQYAEIGGWQGEPDHPAWRKVKRSLAELCGRPTADDGAARAIPPSLPPRHEAPPEAAQRGKPWLLYGLIGVAVIGLAVAGGVLLGQRGSAPLQEAAQAAPTPTATRLSAPAVARAPTTAPEAEAQVPAAPASVAPDRLASADDPPAQANPGDLTFPDSSTRLLQPSEVYPLGPTTLKVARNEIFARKGMRFTTPFLRDWFGRYAWYRPRFDRVPLNPIERSNIELIRQAEARYQ